MSRVKRRNKSPPVAVAPARDEQVQRDMVLVTERLEAHRCSVAVELAAVDTLAGCAFRSKGVNNARGQDKSAHQMAWLVLMQAHTSEYGCGGGADFDDPGHVDGLLRCRDLCAQTYGDGFGLTGAVAHWVGQFVGLWTKPSKSSFKFRHLCKSTHHGAREPYAPFF